MSEGGYEGMEMSNEEIVRRYKEAKNKQQQITILAELNSVKKEDIKAILKENGVDLRGGDYKSKKKPAIINQDFEDAVNQMIEDGKKNPVIEAADPVPGEVGYEPEPEQEPEPKMPPVGLTPRGIFRMQVDVQRRMDIVHAIKRYTEAGMSIPMDWLDELEELC